MRGRARTTNELYLMDAVIEPERLVQISLGQENPRMRMNAAPGSRTIRTRTLKGFHNAVLHRPFRRRRDGFLEAISLRIDSGLTNAI